MSVKYQIIKQTKTTPRVRVGVPYKSKQRARNRVDSLDNQYGAYVHFITTVPANPCDRDMSGPREPLKLRGINWEGC